MRYKVERFNLKEKGERGAGPGPDPDVAVRETFSSGRKWVEVVGVCIHNRVREKILLPYPQRERGRSIIEKHGDSFRSREKGIYRRIACFILRQGGG